MAIFLQGREELEQRIVTMKTGEGWSIRALARHFAISRNMVRRILRKHNKLRDEGHDILKPDGQKERVQRASKLDPYVEKIEKLLEKYPKITCRRLFEELCGDGYTGGISILQDRLRMMRPAPKKEPVVRFETGPGVQGQMDWSPYTIKFLKTGKTTVECFSYILGFSRRHFIDFTERRDFFTLIRRHQDAFEHFCGSPAQCLYDSEKTVVLRWEAGRPVMNPAFSAFITHYRVRPIICQRGRPETKGKIERPFQYVEGNLLCGREFQDLEDLRACARWWLREKSDFHLHETTGRPPLTLFLEQELPALAPLPLHPYDCAEVALRVCDLEGYIEFETNRYPVPYEHVADILTMKATEHEILIYSPELALIVRHERSPAGARVVLDGAAIHGVKTVRYGLEPVREQFLELGGHAEEFLRGLHLIQPKNPGFHARYILRQKEQYHADDINQALGHACRYHAYDGKAVERILFARAKPRTLESIRNEQAAIQLRAALPKITQRSLAEYSILLKHTETQQEACPHEDTGQHRENQDPSQDPEALPDDKRPR
ncbi:MAG: IS21 family transposase [Desulfobacterales bacterium]|nr:IS21 family transposase [Desulfobacterales bacterium]